ncbi:MAG TPA: 5-oxoprolinase subunit PxpB [Candidatus Limnocylindrales bacterium]
MADERDPGPEPRISAFGDAAVLASFGDEPDPALTELAAALAGAVDAERVGSPTIGRAVPAHASVVVPFDPLLIDAADAIAFVTEAARHAADRSTAPPTGNLVEIPVRYGSEDGPDLDEVADAHGLRPDDVVELHAGARYRVLFLGFAPGFAYLGGLPPELATPRRPSPRERVPAGSVGIAGAHTGVYPLSMPGGWNLIGRTDVRLFDPSRPDPAALRPGATVRFVPAR